MYYKTTLEGLLYFVVFVCLNLGEWVKCICNFSLITINYLSASCSFKHKFKNLFSVDFQNLVNKMWIGLASQDKMEIRSCLPKLLLAQHKSVPYFIRNKLCKVIVDIGRQDWPMFYHDFFTNTLQVSSMFVSFSKTRSSGSLNLWLLSAGCCHMCNTRCLENKLLMTKPTKPQPLLHQTCSVGWFCFLSDTAV